MSGYAPCHLAAKAIPQTQPALSGQDATAKAGSALSGKYNSHTTTLEWMAKKDRSLALTHVVQVQNDEQHEWYEAFIDAHAGDVIQLTDFVAKASVSMKFLELYPRLRRGLTLVCIVPRSPHFQADARGGL